MAYRSAHRAEARSGHVHAAERVARVRVKPRRNENKLRPELARYRRKYPPNDREMVGIPRAPRQGR